MARISTIAAVSTLVGVVTLLAFGTWWISRPVPHVAPPQFISDVLPLGEEEELRNKEVLAAFEETSMRSDSFANKESYRMILLPTFHHPILVRASATDKGLKLTTKLLDGKGGYDIGKLFITEERPMTEAEWLHLLELLESSSYWSIRTRTDDPVNDGAAWLLEGRRAEMAHQVFRITPKPKLLETFRYFLQLAGRETDYKGYWQ